MDIWISTLQWKFQFNPKWDLLEDIWKVLYESAKKTYEGVDLSKFRTF